MIKNFIHRNIFVNYTRGLLREIYYFFLSIGNIESRNVIIVFGLGRSGSSFFCDILSREKDAQNFNELFQFNYLNPINLFSNVLKSSRKDEVIIKLLAHQVLEKKVDLDSIISYSQKKGLALKFINLRREPFEQSLSLAYSLKTQNWHRKRTSKEFKNTKIPTNFYINVLENIKINRFTEKEICEKLKNNYGYELVHYEKIKKGKNTSKYKKINHSGVVERIDNLDELKNCFQEYS